MDVIEVPPLPSLTPPFFCCCSSSARWSHFGAAAGWRFCLSRLRRSGGVCLRVCSPHFSPPPQTPSPPLSRKFRRRRHQISEQPKFKWAVTEAMSVDVPQREEYLDGAFIAGSEPGSLFPTYAFLFTLALSLPVFRFSIGETPKPCILLSHLCQPRTDPDLNDDLFRQFSIVLQSIGL